jgi:hypothetical protein
MPTRPNAITMFLFFLLYVGILTEAVLDLPFFAGGGVNELL